MNFTGDTHIQQGCMVHAVNKTTPLVTENNGQALAYSGQYQGHACQAVAQNQPFNCV